MKSARSSPLRALVTPGRELLLPAPFLSEAEAKTFMTEPSDSLPADNTGNMHDSREQSRTGLYRRKAGECLAHAERVTAIQDKARWLQLAESWQKLADRTEGAYEADDFSQRSSSDTTGDERSGRSTNFTTGK